MPSRRGFISGALATAAAPSVGWAFAGHPTHVSAARDPSGDYALYGLRDTGELAFRVQLPGRGHAAAAHPSVAEAVAFARRPGTFALVLDCVDGQVLTRLDAPEGHHFYGHGAFSADGALLFTTENHVESGEGRIGVWSRADGYARIEQIPSHGIGPHEIVRMPDGGFAVANGGIRTHPDRGREKLNLESMRPNLSILNANGTLIDQVAPPAGLHQNSLRHIAVQAEGRVVCGFQWQGDPFDAPPLLAVYRGGALDFLDMPEGLSLRMEGYVGSVGWMGLRRVLASSPRGGVLLALDTETSEASTMKLTDVCGVSGADDGGLVTDGLGHVHTASARTSRPLLRHNLAFDNHLVRIGA